MEWAKALNSGKTPNMLSLQINETMSTAGVPVLEPGAGNAGVILASTTGAANMVGVTIDTATFVTAQQTDGTSAERLVKVIINPDVVWEMLMSGGAAEGTALALRAVTTVSTDGLVVTTAEDWATPTYDEGAVFGFDGANAGQIRKITSVSTTAGTVTVAFDNNTVVGDNFIRVPYWPMDSATIQLTTLLTQADASIAVGTGAAFRCIEIRNGDLSNEGRTKSFVLAISDDHVLRETT